MRYTLVSLFLVLGSINAFAGVGIVVTTPSITISAGSPAPAPVAPTPGVPTPDVALAGMGHFVDVDGAQYWVPDNAPAGYTPYQNGYWSWVNGDGWTWNSNDPWGSYTDHYGVWRHHISFGWIWAPLNPLVYRPNVVTFFSTGGHIGWYPYYPGYTYAFHRGFDDEFHLGFREGRLAFGLTVVPENRFTERNIVAFRVEPRRSVEIFEVARRENVMGRPIARTGRFAPPLVIERRPVFEHRVEERRVVEKRVDERRAEQRKPIIEAKRPDNKRRAETVATKPRRETERRNR